MQTGYVSVASYFASLQRCRLRTYLSSPYSLLFSALYYFEWEIELKSIMFYFLNDCDSILKQFFLWKHCYIGYDVFSSNWTKSMYVQGLIRKGLFSYLLIHLAVLPIQPSTVTPEKH